MVKLIFAKLGVSYDRSNLGCWPHAITEFRSKEELRGELNSKMGVTVLAIDFTKNSHDRNYKLLAPESSRNRLG